MKTVLIDVREPIEFESGHVDGAINIPPAILIKGEPQELINLPRDTKLVVYCHTGSRSDASIPYLQKMGFTNIINGVNKNQAEKQIKSCL